MANYNGIFMRSTLGQTNTLPKPGALSSSPDIIPYGISPVSDPQTFFRSNYDSDPGKALEAKYENYIYLRGKNYSDQKIDDSGDNKPKLFWSKASLLTYPGDWNEITLGPNPPDPYPFSLVADPASIGVINQPYLWKPDNIDPSDHYCMIAQVPSPGYDNKIPNTYQIADFASWVAQNGGIAWRNVIVNNSKDITITNKMSYDQGDTPSKVQFTVICTNVPKGSTISFSAGAVGPNPPIYLEPTTVSTYPSFTTGVVCAVPAPYTTDIYFTLVAPNGSDLTTTTIDIQAGYVSNPGEAAYALGFTHSEFGIPSPDEGYARIKKELERSGESSKLLSHHEMYLEQLSNLAAIGPVRLTVVGAVNNVWK